MWAALCRILDSWEYPLVAILDRQMATTRNAHFHAEMDACEGHESQSQALIQYAPSEIPTGVLFPQLMTLSLEPQHHFPAPARAPALISKVGHLGAGWAGAGVGLVQRFQLQKESVEPFLTPRS